jgi:hypothetical protein
VANVCLNREISACNPSSFFSLVANVCLSRETSACNPASFSRSSEIVCEFAATVNRKTSARKFSSSEEIHRP